MIYNQVRHMMPCICLVLIIILSVMYEQKVFFFTGLLELDATPGSPQTYPVMVQDPE